jgi:hypothetical protein
MLSAPTTFVVAMDSFVFPPSPQTLGQKGTEILVNTGQAVRCPP